eukprot:1813055-Amphidinium_carterae.1
MMMMMTMMTMMMRLDHRKWNGSEVCRVGMEAAVGTRFGQFPYSLIRSIIRRKATHANISEMPFPRNKTTLREHEVNSTFQRDQLVNRCASKV